MNQNQRALCCQVLIGKYPRNEPATQRQVISPARKSHVAKFEAERGWCPRHWFRWHIGNQQGGQNGNGYIDEGQHSANDEHPSHKTTPFGWFVFGRYKASRRRHTEESGKQKKHP